MIISGLHNKMFAIFIINVKSSYKSEKDVSYNETVSQIITIYI